MFKNTTLYNRIYIILHLIVKHRVFLFVSKLASARTLYSSQDISFLMCFSVKLPLMLNQVELNENDIKMDYCYFPN